MELQYLKNEVISWILKGRAAVITGAAYGIGAATAFAFARQGALSIIIGLGC